MGLSTLFQLGDRGQKGQGETLGDLIHMADSGHMRHSLSAGALSEREDCGRKGQGAVMDALTQKEDSRQQGHSAGGGAPS